MQVTKHFYPDKPMDFFNILVARIKPPLMQ